MKQYNEYKDSSVKWIGEIPKHWDAIRIKFIGKTLGGLTYSPDDVCSPEEGIIVLRSSNIKNNELSFYDNVYVKKELQDKDFIKQGDLLICSRNGSADLVGKCAIIDKPINASFGAFMMVLRPSMTLNSKYVYYISQVCIDKYKATFKTSTINQLTNSLLGNIYSPYTYSEHEQKAIVSYLDEKVSKIDRYISTAERKIAALDELKQVTIADAVTHGINSNAVMKDSGIPWIGMVPEHWEVEKIRTHFKERRVKVSDKDYSALSVAKIGIVPQLDDACKTDNGDNRKLVLKGDFVVNSRSDRKGSCGVSQLDGSVSLINIVLEPFEIERRYIHYLFRSSDYVEEFYRNGRGIVADLWTTRYSEMRNIFVPIPPLPEQNEIVAYLDRKVAQIDRMKTAEFAQIEKLKEYKQSLISDVVTGKVKVTND